MSIGPDLVVRIASALGLIAVIAVLARRSLTEPRAAWWALVAAVMLAPVAASQLPASAMLGAFLLTASLLARVSSRAWPARALATALALAALVVAPAIGIVALAFSSWRDAPLPLVVLEIGAGAALAILLDLGPATRILLIIAGAVAVTALVLRQSAPIGRIPDGRATTALLYTGGVIGLFALLLYDRSATLLPPEAFWRAILYGAAAAAAGAVLMSAVVGARTLLTVRDDARSLLTGVALSALVVALLSVRDAGAALFPAGAIAFGVGLARVHALAVPAARALARRLFIVTSPRRSKRG